MRLFVLLSLVTARSAAAAPGAATPIAPSGDVSGTTISFSWQSEPTATWYQFWLGKGTPTGTALVMQQWYTAEQAHCASGGTCTITLTPAVNAGGHTWFVQTYNASGYGPWSTGMGFSMKDPVSNWSSILPDARRFTVVFNGEAVLDNESGLVWERIPPTGTGTLGAAQARCNGQSRAKRRGWRVPTFSELSSLVDDAYSLPAGHPFNLGFNSPVFWSQTAQVDSTSRYALFIGFGPTTSPPDTGLRAWCVRSPSQADY